MTGAMDPADRLASERDLLSLYLDELQKTVPTSFPTSRTRSWLIGATRFAIAMEELDTLESSP
ncbi:hypothetical protein [Mycobacterium paraseoulense]|uniref:Uncharacterized protein n=1 Tax=Mycobacterium paraseoulense TaxID=590652 RepID=A0A1X0IF32_9MYCO|nr:hypothetical protein [Mycobacterium paraseoulense]MCV7393739.1 hypothetical protein [Mycobacterium paraseoulense]ORB45516.1 hypothetical protein BST39_04730 [Mycobacterium paraseoulense]BBZ70643.1 hypothetical protein MPRS_17360 [Mycobacterium paraseoulense]